ncbi:MAG: class I SAM-dependent methyltransferase [Prevotella sp.]|nr:class I SAM-dependent methyltransferase [Prevotella sp.]
MSNLKDYILSHSEPEPEYLHELWRATHLHTLHGHMVSGHLQGRLLKMLVEMIRPQRVLEVGTFSGYSALCMAEGLPEGGHLWTYEINDEMEDFTRKWLENSPYHDRITFMIGDAVTEAPKLNLDFDLAFIDGDKRNYVETYEAILPIVKKGGFLLADNTLWDGHVTDSAYDRDRQTQGIRRFNDHVAADPRTEQVILPIRDGLTLIRKK